MPKQNGSRSRSPSIIARLMGLDGMPHHTSPLRESKPVENQQRQPMTFEKSRGKEIYGVHEALRRGSMEERRFKDVFEVLDAGKEKSSRSLRQRKMDGNIKEAEMAFIREKFIEAKRLSSDEKLRYSREFNETLEALDSNKDLLLKFLHHPDSLFTKHLLHLPHSSQATTLKVDGELLGKSHTSPQWHGGLKPTEIVVLKPNLGKLQTTGRARSPCDEVRADVKLPCTSNQESKAFGRLKGSEDVSLSRRKPRDSRAIARIVYSQMKGGCGSDSSMNFEVSRFKGYAGDESSSESDSSREKARTDFNRKNHRRSLPSRSPGSSVSKEAMRKLSERWKVAHKSERETEIRRSNTLGEMLATSDREARAASFNEITLKKGLSKRSESSVGQSELLEPIGISSRDGWKGTGRRNLSKRRTNMQDDDRPCGHTIVLPKKLTTRDGLVKQSSIHHREFFLSNNSTPVSSNRSSEINRASSSKILYLDSELCREKLPALKTQSSVSILADLDTESGSDYEDAKSNPSLELEQLDLSAVTSLTNHDISSRPTEEVDHSSISLLHPQESSKEGDQPSPVSILQTSCHDEFSFSSECFESLNADLQGLKMKLKLLKRESATYKEGDMLVSSDEDADQEESSSIVTDESLITKEPREDCKSLYLADVLANSRFCDLNHESFVATWHSSDSPLDSSLFEKKYSGLKTATRLERKFLLDRIKSEISEQHPKWDINRIHEKPSRYTKEKEIQWPNLGDDIEVIGKEIEEMLTEELIAELV
ncbi:unnamed protein product [Microthlaspi erraticum]|uniref:DUF4378 domain-containing protein n=1 Tax=Microthlaspi erraticum TaxID=1685480 RepID=A0A6D2JM82_9BRAS|nr:unnamed protein product [Microthlaspi erraticum]